VFEVFDLKQDKGYTEQWMNESQSFLRSEGMAVEAWLDFGTRIIRDVLVQIK